MDTLAEQAAAMIREGDSSQPRPNKPDVKVDAAETVNANANRGQESSKDADKKKTKRKKRRTGKKQPDGGKTKKGKSKKQSIPTDESSDLSEEDDEDSSGEDTDGSEESGPDEVPIHKRASKKAPVARKLKPHKSRKSDKKSQDKLLSNSAASELSESDWDSSDSENEVDEVDTSIAVTKKKAKGSSIIKEIRTQVARELQNLIQLSHAQPALPGFPGLGAGLGGGIDAGLGLSALNYAQAARTALNGYPALPGSQDPSSRPHTKLSDGGVGKEPSLGSRRRRADSPMPKSKQRGGGSAEQDKKSKKIDYKRVDQVWDSTIHNFKLQATAESNSEAKYDGFCFHVRRTFDWEGKYKATMVDIKSKALRECLQDVIGNIKGVSLVDETPKLDPNILFL